MKPPRVFPPFDSTPILWLIDSFTRYSRWDRYSKPLCLWKTSIRSFFTTCRFRSLLCRIEWRSCSWTVIQDEWLIFAIVRRHSYWYAHQTIIPKWMFSSCKSWKESGRTRGRIHQGRSDDESIRVSFPQRDRERSQRKSHFATWVNELFHLEQMFRSDLKRHLHARTRWTSKKARTWTHTLSFRHPINKTAFICQVQATLAHHGTCACAGRMEGDSS